MTLASGLIATASIMTAFALSLILRIFILKREFTKATTDTLIGMIGIAFVLLMLVGAKASDDKIVDNRLSICGVMEDTTLSTMTKMNKSIYMCGYTFTINSITYHKYRTVQKLDNTIKILTEISHESK